MTAAPAIPRAWRGVARVLTAIGDPTRQRILLLFAGAEAPLPLKLLVARLPLSRTATVHHLRVLEDAGVLQRARSGRDVVYRARPEAVRAAAAALDAWIDERFPAGRQARGRVGGGRR